MNMTVMSLMEGLMPHDRHSRVSRCVECRFCDLQVDFEQGTHYFCTKTSTVLDPDVVRKPRCGRFEPPPAAGHWGP